MKRNLDVRKNFIKAIHKVRYARVVNFFPFVQRNAKTIGGYRDQTYKLFNWALKHELIKAIPLIGKDPRKIKIGDPFYCLTQTGADYIGVDEHKTYNEKRIANMDHETAKVDCLLSFIYGFKDYLVEISYGDLFVVNGRDKKYSPDAVIKMWHKNDFSKRYDFVFELERSRKPPAVENEKIKVIENADFSELKRNFRVLFVYAHPYYLVNLRPDEFSEHQGLIRANQDYLQHLLNLSRKYDNKYLFTTLDNFYKLYYSKSPVWMNTKGKRLPLIS